MLDCVSGDKWLFFGNPMESVKYAKYPLDLASNYKSMIRLFILTNLLCFYN